MENTSLIALSRQTALWRQLEAVANNMANANTTAYKGEHVMFDDYLVKTGAEGRLTGERIAFALDVGVLRDLREGPLSKTDNPFDVALHGDGFLVVDSPSGTRFTRNGHLRLDDTGMLVTAGGNPVLQPNGDPIVLAPNETKVDIARDGTVSTENGAIGRLRVVRFDNSLELRKAGDGLFETTAEPTDVERPDIVQGMLEDSNVQPVVEMTRMIDILRSYQSVQKVIETEHERQLKAMQVLSQARA